MKIRTKLRATERRQDRARLAAPQIFPLVGDDLAAQGVTAPLRGGPDAFLGRDRHGRWRQVLIVPTRQALVAARYRDWIDARDAAIVAASLSSFVDISWVTEYGLTQKLSNAVRCF